MYNIYISYSKKKQKQIFIENTSATAFISCVTYYMYYIVFHITLYIYYIYIYIYIYYTLYILHIYYIYYMHHIYILHILDVHMYYIYVILQRNDIFRLLHSPTRDSQGQIELLRQTKLIFHISLNINTKSIDIAGLYNRFLL